MNHSQRESVRQNDNGGVVVKVKRVNNIELAKLTGIEYKKTTTAATMMRVIKTAMMIHL